MFLTSDLSVHVRNNSCFGCLVSYLRREQRRRGASLDDIMFFGVVQLVGRALWRLVLRSLLHYDLAPGFSLPIGFLTVVVVLNDILSSAPLYENLLLFFLLVCGAYLNR